jgi:hypothetical protein
MSINAISASAVKAPSDASSVAVQVAIKQQKEFETTLQLANERREAGLADQRASLEASRREAEEAAKTAKKNVPVEGASDVVGVVASPININLEVRGSTVDVKA